MVFLSYVLQTFKTWTGFQEAINHGMGGIYAREKEYWLGTEVDRYFKVYDNVRPEDLAEYIDEILKTEFDTYCEDGSVLEVSSMFCRAYAMSLVNPNDELFLTMAERAGAIEERVPTLVEYTEETNEENGVEAASDSMKQLTMMDETGVEENYGWITVTKKNKK